MFCNNTNVKYNQKSTLQEKFTWIDSSRPIKFKWRKHKRHVINQNANLYQLILTELLHKLVSSDNRDGGTNGGVTDRERVVVGRRDAVPNGW